MPIQISYSSLLEQPVEYLQTELARFEQSIKHLEYSNRELATAHAAEPDDIYPESIAENEIVIRDQKERVKLISRAIDELLGREGVSNDHYAGQPLTNGSVNGIAQPQEEGLYL